MAVERLQKILARTGVASRRAAEALIQAGRVSIDGKVVTELGVKADPERQKVALDGKPLVPELPVYVVLHKPREVVCTMQDPEGRETVADYMKQVAGRVVPVGRLDYHTSGVLLLTNDGEFAAALVHPSKRVEKVYVAKVRGVVRDDDLVNWQKSIEIEGRLTQPADVRRLRVEGDKTWLEITLREGRNRQIHRIGESAGSMVFRLARVSFAGITSEGLRPGQWRYLGKDELTALKKMFGVPRQIHPAPPLPNAAELRRLRAGGIGRGKRGAADGKPERRRPKKEGAAARGTRRLSSRTQDGLDASSTRGASVVQGERAVRGRRKVTRRAAAETTEVTTDRGASRGRVQPRRTRAQGDEAVAPRAAGRVVRGGTRSAQTSQGATRPSQAAGRRTTRKPRS